VKNFFFHILINDISKQYAPQYQTVVDIPTALEFFGRNPAETRARICAKVHRLVDAWNAKFVLGGGGSGGPKKKVAIFFKKKLTR
jgi:hypothetical protein